MPNHRKTIRHFREPGDCHELTFSCYQQRPLLVRDEWRTQFCEALQRAMDGQAFRLVAFVIMPEHVHLLVYPTTPSCSISNFLYALKRPFSYRIKQDLTEHDPELLQSLTIQERPGKMTFRFWQEGPGYDRNLSTESAVQAAIDYIHLNPVRRGLVEKAHDWKWSSSRWYESDRQDVDPDLPTIHGLPPDYFTSTD